VDGEKALPGDTAAATQTAARATSLETYILPACPVFLKNKAIYLDVIFASVKLVKAVD
jgi:hypothetical protein